jgi:hypothetical protein
MKLFAIFSLFLSSSLLAESDFCKKEWQNKKQKNWNLIAAYETQTLCGYKIKEADQTFENIVSKNKKLPILPNNKNFNQDCEYSLPIDNEWTMCGVGVFEQAASYKKESISNIKL